MEEKQIREYLNKYSITSKNLLAEHIQQLKRNTKPNIELISELVYVLEDEVNVFFNNTPKPNTTSYNFTFDLDKVKGCPKGGLQCFCDGSCHEKKSLDFKADSTFLPKYRQADLSEMLQKNI